MASGSLNLRVRAVDGDGRSVSDTFLLSLYAAQLPGAAAGDIAVVDTHAYFSSNWNLGIADVRDPLAIPQPRFLPLTSGYDAKSLLVVGDLLVLAKPLDGLRLVDIRNPDAPVLIGSLADSGWYDPDITLWRGKVLLGSTFSTIKIIDIANPAAPRQVGSIRLAEDPGAMAARGDLLAVAGRWSPTIVFFDLADPDRPRVLSSLLFPSYATASDLLILGDRLYIARQDGLAVVSLADPAAPVVLGSLALPYAWTRSLELVSGSLYISGGAPGGGAMLHVVDVSDPQAPRLVDAYATSRGGAFGLAASATHLFLAVGDGVEILPLRPPAVPNGGTAGFALEGPLHPGGTLSAVLRSADPDGNGPFVYQWQVSADGAAWRTVGREASYAIAAADLGQQLRLQIRYTDAGGNPEVVSVSAGTVRPPVAEERVVGMEKASITSLPTPELATGVSLRQGEDDRPLRAIGVDASVIDLGGRQSDQANTVTLSAAVDSATVQAQAIGLDGSELLLRPGDDILTIEASHSGGGPGTSIAVRNSFLSGNRGDDTLTLRGEFWGDRAVVFGGDGNDRITGFGIGKDCFLQAGTGDDVVSLGRLQTSPDAAPLLRRDGTRLPVSTYRGGAGFDVLQLRETSQAEFEAQATWFTTAAESGWLFQGARFSGFEQISFG